ncbi:MAG TPA: NUDIX hydrolase [Micromonosporaceae bacterium]
MAALTPVRAAGGVVWRPAAGEPSVCLVHRPRHNDWSLPKGKLTAGEPTIAAAVREVFEETAVRAAPQVRLPSVSYWVGEGLPKTVDYWSMCELWADEFTPNDEVDELCWLPATDAERLLTYGHDGDVLRAFRALPPVSATVTLIRHAEAGDRRAWLGADSARPLEPAGERQAAALTDLLALFAPERLVSASPRRCLQTLAGLADRLDLPIEVDTAFDESHASPDGTVAAERLVAVARSARSTVVCGQGGSIAPALAQLLDGGANVSQYHTPKGDGWLLAFAGIAVVGADRLQLVG